MKVYKTIALALLAIAPILIGSTQLAHFLQWLFDLELNISSFRFTVPSLVICFFVSILERFCLWYRITIVGTLYLNASCFILDYFPSVLSYNITNFVAAGAIIIGIIGCLVHFGIQIKDFIRYVKLKQRA